MASLGIFFINLSVVFLYGFCTFVSLQTLNTLKDWSNFSVCTIPEVFKEVYNFVNPKRRCLTESEDIGWYGLYLGAMFISGSSFLFTLIHLDNLLTGSIFSLSLRESIPWFLTHTINVLGTTVVWYAVAKAGLRKGLQDE